jgi:hypothetical protein
MSRESFGGLEAGNESRDSFIGIEARNDARLSKLETREKTVSSEGQGKFLIFNFQCLCIGSHPSQQMALNKQTSPGSSYRRKRGGDLSCTGSAICLPSRYREKFLCRVFIRLMMDGLYLGQPRMKEMTSRRVDRSRVGKIFPRPG